MGIELAQVKVKKPAVDPIDPDTLAGQVVALSGIAERLELVVGQEATADEPASGLVGSVEELRQTIGRAPNLATGEQGHGLCAVVAELAGAHASQTRKVVTGTTIAAGGVVVVIETVLRILQALNG